MRVLFARGFRPFFLLAGIYACASLVAWLAAYGGLWTTPAGWMPAWWHGHELVYGFGMAAVGGFLLTSVPRWTGSPPVQGAPLAALVALWVLGRVAMWVAGGLPSVAVAICDLLFVPALTAAVVPSLVRAHTPRNRVFPVLLVTLFAGNATMHAGLVFMSATATRTGLYAGLYVLVLLVTLISGRIVPAFTSGALAARGSPDEVVFHTRLGRVAVATVAAFAIADLATAPPWLTGTLALIATFLLTFRASRWRAGSTLREPIVWILHVGHAWLVIGFALLALSDFLGTLPRTAALHALTAGAIGTMVLAVMSRAALGHTGRSLVAPPTAVAAYALVIAGGLVRTLTPLFALEVYRGSVLVSGGLWAAGYLLYVARYAPILLRPRVDGAPG